MLIESFDLKSMFYITQNDMNKFISWLLRCQRIQRVSNRDLLFSFAVLSLSFRKHTDAD